LTPTTARRPRRTPTTTPSALVTTRCRALRPR